jgi:hypothetical protein
LIFDSSADLSSGTRDRKPGETTVSTPAEIFQPRALGLHPGLSLRDWRNSGNTMTKEATEIEVEVLEIDGVAPVKPETHADDAPQQGWRQWQGRVRTLDARWWPLWVLLGIIALALLLTVGIVLGAIYLVIRLCVGIFRAIFG